MNIKKFEARTIKEALEMVKTQLGPDAVILAAKEVTKGFGLGGVKSVEITAAYSEAILKQKQNAQSRMPEEIKNKFNQVSAKSQKEIMQKMIEDQLLRSQPVKPLFPNNLTQKKYIEIDEDQIPSRSQNSIVQETKVARATSPILTEQVQKTWNSMEVTELKNEISQLKDLISQFKPMPQNFSNAHPGAEHGVSFNLSSYYSKLITKGLLPEVASDILVQLQQQTDSQKLNQMLIQPQTIETWISKYILTSVPVVSGGFEQFQLFFGPSGSGKTSSMVKLASQLVLTHKKRVALISTDTVKVGADQQMKLFSEILNLPFISIRNASDWNKVIPYLSQVDHVLVDFASMSLKTESEIQYLKKMMPPVYETLRSHLVLSAKSKDQELSDLVKRYEKINITDVVFTSLDQATQFGSIYNLVRLCNKPLFGFGIGAKVPEDFERATAERVLDLIMEITKNHNTMSSIQQEI